MALTSRPLLAAALVFTLDAGTSRERRSSGEKVITANPAISALTSAGELAEKKARCAEALTAY